MKKGAPIRITDDLFAIADSVRSVDPDYKIYYDKGKHRFEVYTGDPRSSVPIVIPYPRLDRRTVTYLRKTRVERMERLAEEIEAENARAERAALSRAKSEAEKALGEIL